MIQEALTQFLNIDVASGEWDEPPSLVLIVQNRDGSVTFDPVPVGEAWGAAPPYMVIVAAGQSARKVHEITGWSPLEKGENLLGIALFSEGWGLSADAADADALKAWVEAGNKIEGHPNRVEFKMVTALLTDENTIMLTHERGGKVEVMKEGTMEGRIPESLRRALSDFQEVSH
jgi:hypothetical protein